MKQIPRSRIIFGLKVQLALGLLAAVTILAFIPVFTYLYYAKDLTTKEGIMNRNNTGIVLLDRDGKTFFTFYEAENKEFISLNKIPLITQQAVIAIEDEEFYQHPGFSFRAIVRSVVLDIKGRGLNYGGSTLTQQLVKNSLLSPERSLMRKYQEIVLAQELERRYSKDEILEMYLNSVYFGEGAFGIQQASRVYYGKDTSDLNLAESAMLAGILPAPSRYSPLSANRSGYERQKLVLKAMLNQKLINNKQHDEALKTSLRFSGKREEINNHATHFAIKVRNLLVDRYGEEFVSRSGFKVKTTLDSKWQKQAELTLRKKVEELASSNVSNGAVVVIDVPTGEVRVMVGSKDWFDEKSGRMNLADSPRSPGSAFKPIIYAAALEKKIITAATSLHDNPTTFQGNYKPQNYDRKFRGNVLVRRALANSLNVPAVEVMQKVGVVDGLEIARRLGITTLKQPVDYGLSLVLGTGEVKLTEITNAYATFANNGVRNDLTYITEITNKQGKVVYKNKANPRQVIPPGVSFILSSILSDARARAEMFGKILDTTTPAAVKTGTGEDYRSALTIGYTRNTAVGVWLGNNNNAPMGSIAGSLGPAPIWKELIETFSAESKPLPFSPTPDVITASICNYSGLLASRGFSGSFYNEYFLSGTQPSGTCLVPRPTGSDKKGNKPDVFFEIRKPGKDNPGRGGLSEDEIKKLQQEVRDRVNQQIQEMQITVPPVQ